MRIGIAGIAGRMGTLLVEEVAASGATLVGGTIRPGADTTAMALPAGVEITDDIDSLAANCDVVVDFTNAAAAITHAEVLARAGTAWVLGTSGLDMEAETAVIATAKAVPVVYAPNFAPGVTLVLALAETLARALPSDAYDAEILEMHHRQKVDAPSGTALGLGRAVASARGVELADVMESGRHGHTGARRPDAIGFAALRGGQMVGEHTLLFAGASEHIALTHRAFDRRVFAAGAVRAALWTAGRQPGLYSMADVLGLAKPSETVSSE